MAIGSLNLPTIVFPHIRDGSFLCSDRKGSFGPGCHPTDMHTRIVQMGGDMGRDDISWTETMGEVPGLRFSPWKTQGIHQTHLATSMAIGDDEQRDDPLDLQGFGVLAPTHTASCQCVFSKPRVIRLNLVRPPVPHSTGNPKTCNRS